MIVIGALFVALAVVCAFFTGISYSKGHDEAAMWWYSGSIGAGLAGIAFVSFA